MPRSASTPACATAKHAASGRHDLDHRDDPLTTRTGASLALLHGRVETLYPDWHPEHVSWRWLRGQPLAHGTVWHTHERVGRMRISGRFKVLQAEPERFFSYTLGFPSSLVRAGGSFSLEPLPPGGCELIQDVHLGFTIPVLARLLDPIIALVVPLRELRRHMREEQANLTTLLAATP